MDTSTLATPHNVTLTPTPTGSTTLDCSVCGPLGTHLLSEVADAERRWHQERHNQHAVTVHLPEGAWQQLQRSAANDGSTVQQWTRSALTKAVA